MKLFLKIWRQKDNKSKGAIVNYEINNISPDMSFLEMMDVLNEEIISSGGDPVAFDHDCREGICGSCSMFINGEPHGPDKFCLLYTSPSPRDRQKSRMPSSA